MMNTPHVPILVTAVLNGLQATSRSEALYIDGTLGAGGHSAALLDARPDNQVIGFDRDPYALELAAQRLAIYGERAQLVQGSYLEMGHVLGDRLVDGVLLDLGLSSMQLDQAERGFAFRFEGPLDMRFDPASPIPSAADLVNNLSAEAIADILFRYGEEHYSRRIAKAIVSARPITTTRQLANLIEGLRLPPQKIHPATRTFQALRIAVNDELEAVEAVLPLAIQYLKQGGRLVVITFHSLEDRIVKQLMKTESTDCLCPPRQPICTCGHQATLKLITRKPIVADEAEIKANPRARSAKLRIAERL